MEPSKFRLKNKPIDINGKVYKSQAEFAYYLEVNKMTVARYIRSSLTYEQLEAMYICNFDVDGLHFRTTREFTSYLKVSLQLYVGLYNKLLSHDDVYDILTNDKRQTERKRLCTRGGVSKSVMCYNKLYETSVEFCKFLCVQPSLVINCINSLGKTYEQIYDMFVCDIVYDNIHFNKTTPLLDYHKIEVRSYTQAYSRFNNVKDTVDFIIQVRKLSEDLFITHKEVRRYLITMNEVELRKRHTINIEINGILYTCAQPIAKDFDIPLQCIIYWIQEDITLDEWIRRLSPVNYKDCIYKTEFHWIEQGFNYSHRAYLDMTHGRDNPQQYYLQSIHRRNKILTVGNFHGIHVLNIFKIFNTPMHSRLYKDEDTVQTAGTELLWNTADQTGFRGFTEDDKVIHETNDAVVIKSFSDFLAYVTTLNLNVSQ